MISSLLRDIASWLCAKIPDEDDRRYRGQLSVWLSAAVLVWGPFWMGIFIYLESRAAFVIAAVATLVAAAGLPLLRLTGQPGIVGQMLVIALMGGVFGMTWISGGIHSPFIAWVALAPIILGLVGRKTSTILAGALSLAGLLVFHLLALWDVELQSDFSASQLETLSITSNVALVGVLCMIGVVTACFTNTQRAIWAETERLYREERRRAQERQEALRDTEHIWAVGRISAELAHEVNNPNAWVMANLEALSAHHTGEHLLSPPALQSTIEDALNGARRVAQVTSDLRTMARPPSERVATAVDITSVLTIAVRIARTTASGRIEIDVGRCGVPKVQANDTALGQAVLNLLSNALEALTMANTPSPSVHVRCWTEAAEACIEVADNGPGIRPEVLAQIFNPHFTTKHDAKVSGGTGLGLSLSRRAVRQMGGRLEASSEVGKGSRFRIWLKLAKSEQTSMVPEHTKRAAESAHVVPTPDVEPRSVNSGGTRGAAATEAKDPTARNWRILAVDDEPMLLRAMSRMLRDTSVDLTTTTRVSEAIELVDGGSRFDLILCDLRMPGADPGSLYHALSAIDPEQAQKIAIMTGGTRDEAARVLPYESLVLFKPFGSKQLLELIQ